jgi:ribonuclease HII
MLRLSHTDNTKYEICIDEVGRGCLFGRAYIACVILPKNGNFDGQDIKDSKKFTSKKKIKSVSEYIKQNPLFYHIAHVENDTVDEKNILQAVMQGMHECIQASIEFIKKENGNDPFNKTDCLAIIDGNYFKPYLFYDDATGTIEEFPAITVEKGDATYMGIAAASILAKVARDEYILELCEKHPCLKEHYQLHTNMGYGTKVHLEGIQKYGATNLHRKSFRGTSSAIAPSILENL